MTEEICLTSFNQIGAMDRALLQMCSIDWVLLDLTSTVVGSCFLLKARQCKNNDDYCVCILPVQIHVRIGSELCDRPPSIESLMAALREHHQPGFPAHLIYSAHEGCEGLTTRFFTQLIRARWNLNTTRPQLSDARHPTFYLGAPVIEQSDGTFGDIDRHLCAMVYGMNDFWP